MRVKTAATALLALALISSDLPAFAFDDGQSYRQAVELYKNGMYDRARSLFEKNQGDPLSEGYIVLCALKTQSSDAASLVDLYGLKYPDSVLGGLVHFEYARILFDQGSYGEAYLEFKKVNANELSPYELSEYMYKCSYCSFSLGRYDEAREILTIMEALDFTEYTAPAHYISGVIYYNDSDFADAETAFRKASVDPRFKSLADFYIVDCRFNQNDYGFAISEGERLYQDAPGERRERLARIISEAALILGDIEKARLYFDDLSREDMNRKDYFYAGTVLYSVRDYRGAIDNYLKMGDRRDSLGQIASYHMANSYLSLKNQVAAMDAFKAAADLGFDEKMTEDASFNYAKLAFDLNKDTSGFADYLKKYSTDERGEMIYGYMALAALYDRDYAAAVEAYDNIEELDPDMENNYTKANFLRGRQLYASGSYKDATPFFRATAYYLPKTDRLSQTARYYLAEAYYKMGEYKEAETLYAELYNASALYDLPEGAILSYNAAYSNFKQGKYADAARWFDTYLQSGHAQFREDAMSRRADCDFGRRDYKAAIVSYKKLMDTYFSANNIYPYYQLALSYGLSGDRKKKLSTLRNVEKANSGFPLYYDAWYELGRVQMELKNNNDAIRSFTHLREVAKDNAFTAKALSGLGMVYRNMSKYDESLKYYKEIVSLMPGSEYAEEAMLAIESIYQTRRQPDKFLEYLEKNSLTATRTEAEKEKMYFTTAEQLYLDGSYSEAVNSINKFLQNFPSSKDADQAIFYLAESYRAMGDKERAIDAYAKAMSSKSAMSFVEMSKLRYADLSYDIERYADAYKAYLALLETSKMETNKSVARLGMMRSAYKSKEYAMAVKAAESVAAEKAISEDIRREADYVRAKSLLGISRRSEAIAIFKELSKRSSTPEGAEASYILIQNYFDTGQFDSVEGQVYAFSQAAGDQSYWLAKAYLVLGDTFVEKRQYEQAKATFESIRDGYESSNGDDVADNVIKRLENLNKLMQK